MGNTPNHLASSFTRKIIHIFTLCIMESPRPGAHMLVQALLEAILYISIVTPYFIYAWAYRRPWQFLHYFKPERFEQIGIVFKVISNTLEGYFAITGGVNWSGLPIGVVLFVVGQVLNSAVYKRLGAARTYYGFEFGLLEPEIMTGFPFYLYHAQYKGSLLSALGMLFGFNPSPILTIATACWVLSYLFIIQVEDGPPGPHKLKD